MNSKLLCLFVTSVVVATSAIALPSRSLADEVTGVDTPPTSEDVTANSPDDSNVNAENTDDIQTRGSRSHRRFRRNNQLNRPPSADDVNNAGTRNRSNGWLWF
ncbi:hypothetical protein [Merismopedia glauca]|uniref:Uncharacterized protein n=1 Tax=Merismopedia glauca CCAP 1448/3 TaxID=1296344 RepID=A0A2T1BYX4_9CYAN|nr:hypothetical protein [Merismopedia glauca]PSB01144.1 hypothetical protein C7B64_19825 [Merismopedia glauca CCAP 1448/3]